MCTFRKWVTRNPVIPSVSTEDRGWVDTSVPLTRKRTWLLPTANVFVDLPSASSSLIASCPVQSTTVGVSLPTRSLGITRRSRRARSMSYARRHSTNVCPGNRVRYKCILRHAVRDILAGRNSIRGATDQRGDNQAEVFRWVSSPQRGPCSEIWAHRPTALIVSTMGPIPVSGVLEGVGEPGRILTSDPRLRRPMSRPPSSESGRCFYLEPIRLARRESSQVPLPPW